MLRLTPGIDLGRKARIYSRQMLSSISDPTVWFWSHSWLGFLILSHVRAAVVLWRRVQPVIEEGDFFQGWKYCKCGESHWKGSQTTQRQNVPAPGCGCVMSLMVQYLTLPELCGISPHLANVRWLRQIRTWELKSRKQKQVAETADSDERVGHLKKK